MTDHDPMLYGITRWGHNDYGVNVPRDEGVWVKFSDHVEFVTGIIRSLMFSENGGDTHDVIDRLCKAVGIPRLEGDYLDGWTDADMRSVGLEPEDD